MKKFTFILSLALTAILTLPFANTAMATTNATFSMTVGQPDISPAPSGINTVIHYPMVYKNTSSVNSDIDDACYYMFTTEDGTMAMYSEDWYDVPTVMAPGEEFEFTVMVFVEGRMADGVYSNSIEIYDCDGNQRVTAPFEYQIGA